MSSGAARPDDPAAAVAAGPDYRMGKQAERNSRGAMRLSEAIRLGTMMTSQAFRTLFTGDRACAWGAALPAGGPARGRAVRWAALSVGPWAFAVRVTCPSCGGSRLVCEVIAHL